MARSPAMTDDDMEALRAMQSEVRDHRSRGDTIELASSFGPTSDFGVPGKELTPSSFGPLGRAGENDDEELTEEDKEALRQMRAALWEHHTYDDEEEPLTAEDEEALRAMREEICERFTTQALTDEDEEALRQLQAEVSDRRMEDDRHFLANGTQVALLLKDGQLGEVIGFDDDSHKYQVRLDAGGVVQLWSKDSLRATSTPAAHRPSLPSSVASSFCGGASRGMVLKALERFRRDIEDMSAKCAKREEGGPGNDAPKDLSDAFLVLSTSCEVYSQVMELYLNTRRRDKALEAVAAEVVQSFDDCIEQYQRVRTLDEMVQDEWNLAQYGLRERTEVPCRQGGSFHQQIEEKAGPSRAMVVTAFENMQHAIEMLLQCCAVRQTRGNKAGAGESSDLFLKLTTANERYGEVLAEYEKIHGKDEYLDAQRAASLHSYEYCVEQYHRVRTWGEMAKDEWNLTKQSIEKHGLMGTLKSDCEHVRQDMAGAVDVVKRTSQTVTSKAIEVIGTATDHVETVAQSSTAAAANVVGGVVGVAATAASTTAGLAGRGMGGIQGAAATVAGTGQNLLTRGTTNTIDETVFLWRLCLFGFIACYVVPRVGLAPYAPLDSLVSNLGLAYLTVCACCPPKGWRHRSSKVILILLYPLVTVALPLMLHYYITYSSAEGPGSPLLEAASPPPATTVPPTPPPSPPPPAAPEPLPDPPETPALSPEPPVRSRPLAALRSALRRWTHRRLRR